MSFFTVRIYRAFLALALGIVLTGCQKEKTKDPLTTAEKRPEQLDARQIASRNLPCVFLLEVYNAKGEKISTGTGFLISSQGQMVTNRHVIQGAHHVTAKSDKGLKFNVEGIVSYRTGLDAVVLQLAGPLFPKETVVRTQRPPEVGEKVVCIGCPEGLQGTVSEGIVSSIRGADYTEFPYGLQFTCPVSSGSSGSPIFDIYGSMIGVATVVRNADGGGVAQNLNFAIPAAFIWTLAEHSSPELIEFEKFPEVAFTSDLHIVGGSEFYYPYSRAMADENYSKAVRTARELVSQYSQNPVAYFYLGEALAKDESFDAAIMAYGMALKIYLDYKDAWKSVIVCLEHEKLDRELAIAYENLARLSPSDGEVWCSYSSYLSKQGKEVEALEALKKAILLNPDVERPWVLLGGILIKLERYQEAEAFLRKAVVKFPENTRFWLDLASSLERQQKLDESIAVLRESIVKFPGDIGFKFVLGGMLSQTNQLGPAVDLLTEVCDTQPDNDYARYCLAVDLGQLRRHDEAIKHFKIYLSRCPDDKSALSMLGFIYFMKNDFGRAITCFQKIYESDKSYESAADYLGRALFYGERYAEARVVLEDAVERNPKNSETWLCLGDCYLRERDYERALIAYRSSAALDRNSARAWSGVAVTLVCLKRMVEALPAAQMWKDLSPENAKAWKLLGCCLYECGRESSADYAFEKARSLDQRSSRKE
jgi:tetratricopeptide (TPR) repeat protein